MEELSIGAIISGFGFIVGIIFGLILFWVSFFGTIIHYSCREAGNTRKGQMLETLERAKCWKH